MRLISEKRLAEVRQRCQREEFAPAYGHLRGEAEAFLGLAMEPPDEPAGFYHNYFCPEHGVELVFSPDEPQMHRCPRDGRVFSGEPYDSAWRWFVNNRLSTMAFKLAILWHIDGNETRLRRVEDILSGYARRYPGFSPGGSENSQGRATFQSLDEAVWLIPLVRAYDLVRQELAPGVQQSIEDDLLRPAAGHILEKKYNIMHNIECWHNAAVCAVALCLGEDEWARLAIEAENGYYHQLYQGVFTDGLWWEGSSSYHFYALAALMTQAQIAEVEDRSLIQVERLKEMFRAPVLQAHPDLSLPATNDCWFFTSLLEDVCHGVPQAMGFYEVAYGWYGEDLFAQVLHANYAQKSRTSLEALLYGGELPEATDGVAVAGANFPESGFAVLRSQDAPESQNYLLLKYGPHGGGHGHPDKLGISFYARGYGTAPDLGTPGYGIDLHQSWYRQSLSHNTVLVDGRSQPEAAGQLVHYDNGEESDFGVADARVNWEGDAYDGICMRRTILWTSDYFIDLFQVECGGERQLDWACRLRGQLEESQGLEHGKSIQLEGDGYAHIAEAIAASAQGSAQLEWALPQSRLLVFLPQEADTQIIQGQVPFNPAAETSDILLRRRRTANTSFLSLFHACDGEPKITQVTCADDVPEGAWGIWVDVGKKRELWCICERDSIDMNVFSAKEADSIYQYFL